MHTLSSSWPAKLWSAVTQFDTRALPERAQYGYIPGLDGLRAVSVMIVIIAHFGLDHIVPGGFGVTVFFFISGFLITRLLLAEQDTQGTVRLKQFYLRRLVRLYPALLFMVLGSTLYFMTLGYGGPSPTELLAAVFYFTNMFQVSAAAQGGEMPFMSWTHLWSLAVEEHFYLLFPLIVVGCGAKLNRLRQSLILLLVAIPVWRYITLHYLNVPYETYNYMMTDARIDSIGWGCLLTVLLHEAGRAERFKRLIGVGPVLLAFVVLLASFLIREETFRYVLRYSLQGGCLFILFLNFYYLKLLRFSVTLMEWAPLAWIGRTSYAIYLWHFPVFDASQRLIGEGLAAVGLALIVTILLSAVSLYWIEQPCNRWRAALGSKEVVRP